jgi:hypothetical protein
VRDWSPLNGCPFTNTVNVSHVPALAAGACAGEMARSAANAAASSAVGHTQRRAPNEDRASHSAHPLRRFAPPSDTPASAADHACGEALWPAYGPRPARRVLLERRQSMRRRANPPGRVIMPRPALLVAVVLLLVAAPVTFAAVSITRAELDGGQLRVEGRGAVAGATITVSSPGSTATGRADPAGASRPPSLPRSAPLTVSSR